MTMTARLARFAAFSFTAAAVTWHAPLHAADEVRIVDVAPGWAANSVNAVVFRKNSLVTHGDTQYIAFYDKDAYVVL